MVSMERKVGWAWMLALCAISTGCGTSEVKNMAQDAGAADAEVVAGEEGEADAAPAAGGDGVDVGGFEVQERDAILACLNALPATLEVDLDIVRDSSDQSGCVDPLSLPSTAQEDGCGLSKLSPATGQSTLYLYDQLMKTYPEFLCYELTRAAADLWIHHNTVEALVAYQASFGVINEDECYPCPPDDSAPCEARDAVDHTQTRDSHKRARLDLREVIAATVSGSWPYDHVRWVDDADEPCTATSRTAWVQQAIVAGESVDVFAMSFDVAKVCGEEAEGVRIRFTPDPNGSSETIYSFARYEPNDGIGFYNPASPVVAGETWLRRHGTGESFWIEGTTYWSTGDFNATVHSCTCEGEDIEHTDGAGGLCN